MDEKSYFEIATRSISCYFKIFSWTHTRTYDKKIGKHPGGVEPPMRDSKSRVLTTTLQVPYIGQKFVCPCITTGAAHEDPTVDAPMRDGLRRDGGGSPHARRSTDTQPRSVHEARNPRERHPEIDNTVTIAQAGAIAPLVALLSVGRTDGVNEEAVRALLNLGVTSHPPSRCQTGAG